MSRHPWLSVAVAASLTILGLPWLSPTPANAAATFAETMPDAAYRSCVTTKLGLASDAEPSESQLASVTELSCTSRDIQDATGTSAMPNLAKLFLGGNAISDVTPLATSTKLFSLGLENNQLSDIAPLASLTKLRSVTLAGNRLRDLTALSVLPEYSAISGTRHAQKATAAEASVGIPAMVPTVISAAGKKVSPTAPDGVTVTGSTVTYPAAGGYTWSFRDPDDFSFNGSVSVAVTDSATTIPDAALRGCLNSRLGQAADIQPTPSQLAGLTGALSCGNKGVRDLTGLNLATGLTSLTLNGNSISDISPIAALTNLTSANLALNSITSIATLGSLPKLTTLQLQQNLASTKPKLISLAGIEGLTRLTAITANYTALRSLSPLAGNTSLKNLTATNNLITDVSPLASAGSQLANVDLSGNQLGDLSAVKEKSYTKLTATGQTLTAAPTKATVETDAPSVVKKDGSTLVATPPTGVTATAGKVTYVEPGSYEWTFSAVDSLQGTNFTGRITQQVDEAPPVTVSVDVPDAAFKSCLAGLLSQDASAELDAAKLAGLSEVSCTGRRISDLTGAQALTGTKTLTLSTNAITDLRPLARLTGLKQLLLPGNAITDVSPLAGLTGLETLSLSYNPISSIAALAPLTGLTDLEVTQKSTHSGADLASLDGVQTMTGLTRLVVNNSSLTSVEQVVGLIGLKRLFFSNNKVADLTPLRGLAGLTSLGANTNQISDVSALAGLTSLTDVDLATNRILDLSPLKNLSALGYLGLKARWQQVRPAAVPARLSVAVPQPRDVAGVAVEVAAPDGLTVHDGQVSYPEPGSYEWTFTARTDEGTYFSGTITQDVTAQVSGAAEIPDAGLRGCLAAASGLGDSGIPTKDDVAALTSVACPGKGIGDLTGAELLTSATALDLSGNPLGSLRPLAKLARLASLDLSNTGLSQVTGLAGLIGLTSVKLDGNALRDLSPLGGLAGLVVSAEGQRLSLEPVAGGVAVQAPTVTTVSGTQVAATAPDGATTSSGKVTFARAGRYQWAFRTNGFSGSFTQVVTSDVPDAGAHTGAAACVQSGKVWVVVERDTGSQQGGCATQFSTGLEALASAGFAPAGTGFVTAIDGYPARSVADSYWSYWHGTDPATAAGTTTYRWTYSSTGAADHHPASGSIEGWRFESWKVDPVAPSWTPVITASVPTPGSPSPSDPTKTPTPSGGVRLGSAKVKATYGKPVTIVVTVTPAAAGTVTATVAGRSVTATVAKGRASLRLPAGLLRPGTRQVALRFAGDGASAEATGTVVVAKASAKVSVKVKGTTRRGRSATFRVTVSSGAGTPTGRVRVELDGRSASAKLNAKGVATVKLNRISKAGKPTAKVTYGGSALLKSKTVKKKVRVRR